MALHDQSKPSLLLLACLQRCILAPANAQVDLYNTTVLNLLPSTSRQCYAADSLEEYTDVTQTVNPDFEVDSPLPNPDAVLDYVWCQRPNGMPDYNPTVKVGGVYRLLRNLSIDLGLVKNVRVVIVGLGSKLTTIRMLQNTQTPGSQCQQHPVTPHRIQRQVAIRPHTLPSKIPPRSRLCFHVPQLPGIGVGQGRN